ncbi:MAG: hypothetical protein GVY20_02025 [Bacteroidetes bacterium]|jgi:hypothetical protein|nr:hypothetical protein [Bacteroidota bacterium]
MKETIFLIATKNGIDRMVKRESSATDLRKNEIPIKLTVKISEDNWKPPFIEKEVVVDRWDKGVELIDVDFEGSTISKEEAEILRQRRINKAAEMLEQQGYQVTKVDES